MLVLVVSVYSSPSPVCSFVLIPVPNLIVFGSYIGSK